MKTLGVNGMKVHKIFHLLFAVMWIGGVMALVSLMLGTNPSSAEMAYMAAIDHKVIDDFFLIPGGVGIVITAISYGIFTKWGFFKHRWIVVKWVLTILLVIIGAGYMGRVIGENLLYMQEALQTGSDWQQYFVNVRNVAISGIIQLVGFAAVLIISVVKPWKKNKHAKQ